MQFGSEVTTVKNNAGNTFIHHSKYGLFSSLYTKKGLAEKVVLSTFHNFAIDDTREVQNAMVFNKSSLYQEFLNNFEETKRKADHGIRQFKFREFTNEASYLTIKFYPKRKNGSNLTGDSIKEFKRHYSPSNSYPKRGHF